MIRTLGEWQNSRFHIFLLESRYAVVMQFAIEVCNTDIYLQPIFAAIYLDSYKTRLKISPARLPTSPSTK